MVFISLRNNCCFTLIELLVVIAILSLLLLVLLPIYQHAYIKSLSSKAFSELRYISVALQTYWLENQDFPPNDGFANVIPKQLSTPINYISTNQWIDPFRQQNEFDPERGGYQIRLYTYTRNHPCANQPPNVPFEGSGCISHHRGVMEKYGKWRLVSIGPDREYSPRSVLSDQFDWRYLIDISYEPSNGLYSFGDIYCTQKMGFVPIFH